ncbi:gluconate 2-dehydrogenase subunit 3 family protein [Microbulbifer epialgicus]|uniref:Gluconate 2-dehydrogenase subunit 3 family protein n=1 Tax=Microbulbifer epialgicus TaxID=393907 RepID=A0ABV4NXY5_9GAMM
MPPPLLRALDAGDAPFSPSQRDQFKVLKHIICFGYYTSLEGATQELAYQAIPGGFKGSIPLAQTGKGWGSLARY